MTTNKLPVKTYKLRRRKTVGLILFILGQIFTMFVFIKLGYWLVRSPGRILCVIAILVSFMLAVFGIVALVSLIREHFVAFFVSIDGMNDVSTGHNYGVVMWRDVTKIRIMEDIEKPGRKYIILKVKNPQEYIDRETSHAKKRSMMLKLHYYGSPICFSNRAINTTFEELEETIRLYYAAHLQRVVERKKTNPEITV